MEYEDLFSKNEEENFEQQQIISNLEEQIAVITSKYEEKTQECRTLKEDMSMLHNHWRNIVEEKDEAYQLLER